MASIGTADVEHLAGFHFASKDLADLIRQQRPELVIFDPIQAFFPPGVSMTSRQQCRETLDVLVSLAQAYNTAFLLVCHTNKKKTPDWRQRINGSDKDKQELIILVTPRLVDEESSSTAEMSDDLRKMYQQGRQDKANMNKVDLNESLPEKTEDASKEPVTEKQESAVQAKEDAKDVAAEMSTDSVLGKYLNRESLPKK